MLVCHKYKFIYLKSLKTASTSVFVFFTPYCISQEKLQEYKYELDENFHGVYEEGIVARNKKSPTMLGKGRHVPAADVRMLLSEIDPAIWPNYFKFTTVRNPWDLCVSRYFYHKNYFKVKGSFKEFIFNMYNIFKKNKANVSYPYYRINKKYVCDYYIKQENLIEGIKEVCERCGIKDYDLNKIPKMNTNFRPKNLHYSQMYNGNLKDMVYTVYKDDIEKFNYKFELENI